MTRPEFTGDDLAVRAAIRDLVQPAAPPFALIDAGAASIIRRSWVRRSAVLAVVTALVALLIPLTPTRARPQVQTVTNDHSRRDKSSDATVASTTGTRNATSSSLPHRGLAPAIAALPEVPIATPTPASTRPVSNDAQPSASPAPAPGPRSTTTVFRSSPVTSTTVPAPQYPPIGAGHTRLTVVFDDNGLHAPASHPAGNNVEILYVDARSKSGAVSWLYSAGNVRHGTLILHSWDGSLTPLPAKYVPPDSYVFQVLDWPCSCPIPGATATVTMTNV